MKALIGPRVFLGTPWEPAGFIGTSEPPVNLPLVPNILPIQASAPAWFKECLESFKDDVVSDVTAKVGEFLKQDLKYQKRDYWTRGKSEGSAKVLEYPLILIPASE